MPSYEEWNEALVEYFVARMPTGTQIYLNADEEAIGSAGRLWLARRSGAMSAGPGEQRPLDDFLSAVRDRVRRTPGRVALGALGGRQSSGLPMALGFLSASVLAAIRMADEGDISDINYFTRLREVLSLPLEPGRPPGMEFGASSEEPLWREWNLWLQENGYLPSAQRGPEGPSKYISYPMSQALLRRADKDRLHRLFRDRHWTQDWDEETLLSQVRQAGHLTQHLQDLLTGGGRRLEAMSEDLYDEYQAWLEDPSSVDTGLSHGVRSTVTAGLYRIENPIIGQVSYYLYPRVRRGQVFDGSSVSLGERKSNLVEERSGWLAPIGPIESQALENGARLPIDPPTNVDTLVLPKKEFWILVPERDDPDSGILATWAAPQPGTAFVLLCREDLLEDLQLLREEQLVEWAGAPVPVLEHSGWMELRQCMVVRWDWQGVFPKNRDLYESLRPRQTVSVGLAGGLRIPSLAGWLEGCGPSVTVYGVQSQSDVRLVRASDEQIVFDEQQPTSIPFTLTWPGAGLFRLEADCGGQVDSRLVRLIAWDELRMSTAPETPCVPLGDYEIQGALIREAQLRE